MKAFVLCYDIPEDKERSRLARLCERFGIRVQYSVFEFRLDETRWIEFHGLLDREGFLGGDHALLFYPLLQPDRVLRYGAVRTWGESFETL